ncbi:MAG: 3-methyl-2-oxobutanoate hydroxymethyltransferase [Desulfocapsaceae bacterium]|nr:3-methyl-2-oxobutanoate hydroxymethyltransferase [Desulfocapsaceae bacterium]
MKKKNIQDFLAMKKAQEKITVLTAYDASIAGLLHACDVDVLLVGDSLGNVVLGYDSTVPVTMEEMLHHASAVRRGAPGAFVVGDMPFGSYQSAPRDAILNATRFLKEAGCDAVKLEGGLEICDTVRAMVRAGISVMGHIGLTPQTAMQLGGYKVQGRDVESARRLLAEAKGLAEAGAFSMVLECVPSQLAEIITESVSVPTIGIGAGPHCDGQVLVINDLLGMFDKYTPSFVKVYTNLAPIMKESIARFNAEVRSGTYPDATHSFSTQTDLRTIVKDS